MMAGPRDEGDEKEDTSQQSARLFGMKIWGGLGLNCMGPGMLLGVMPMHRARCSPYRYCLGVTPEKKRSYKSKLKYLQRVNGKEPNKNLSNSS